VYNLIIYTAAIFSMLYLKKKAALGLPSKELLSITCF
jgi:hypothetical protein